MLLTVPTEYSSIDMDNEGFEKMLGSLSDNGIDDGQEGDGYKPYVLDKGAYNITIKCYTYKIEINASFKDGTEIYKDITYYKKG